MKKNKVLVTESENLSEETKKTDPNETSLNMFFSYDNRLFHFLTGYSLIFVIKSLFCR